jgi:hypothetical protein
MFVGAGLDPTTVLKRMKPICVNVVIAPLKTSPDTLKSGPTPPRTYDRSTGILTVTLNLSVFANDFTSAVRVLLRAAAFLSVVGQQACTERDAPCGHAGEGIDCPTGGVGFSVTLPAGFVARGHTTANNSALVQSLATCFPKDANWNVTPMAAPSRLVGTCVNVPMNKTGDFCRSAPAMVRFPAPQRR